MTIGFPSALVLIACGLARAGEGEAVLGQPAGPPPSVYVIEGTVSDDAGALPGATVLLVEVGRVVATDVCGRFHFDNVPAGRVTVDVHLQGFRSAHVAVVVPLASPLAVHLDADLRYEEEIVVSAAPWALRPLETAQQTDQVAAADVRRARVASLGDAMARVPGVAFIPTGNALGTPVIRGISENRIRVLHDGIALNHQQFSWRHAPNVEPGFAERIELIRGPSSVLYGPEAMGGVINVIHAPLPLAPDRGLVLHGEVSPGFSSNAAEWAGQGRFEGAVGRFGWRADAVRRGAGDITTPRGSLSNTDFAQTNATLMAGYSGGWGTARVRWHHWQNETGFHRPEQFRLDLHDDLLAGDLHLATRAGVVEVLLGRQVNHREAFDHAGDAATLDLRQETLTARSSLEHPGAGTFRGQLAFEYQGVANETRRGTLLPDYHTDNLAAVLFEEARFLPARHGFHRLIFSLGLRGDMQTLRVTRGSTASSADYGAFTGGLGVVLRLHARAAVAGSVGRGWRPPTAFELYASGIHGGIAAFQVGTPTLREEANLNTELSARYRGPRVEATVSLYRNAFDDYIYLSDSGRMAGSLPVFEYRQADAVLKGIEATFDVAPRQWLKLTTSWTWSDTRNEATGRRLPQTPADRLLAGLELVRQRIGPIRQAHVALDASFVGEGRVSGPDEPLGTPTSRYAVCDVRAGVTRPAGRTSLDLALVVRNLFNREYRDFLWSYKPYAPNPGRDLRLTATWRF